MARRDDLLRFDRDARQYLEIIARQLRGDIAGDRLDAAVHSLAKQARRMFIGGTDNRPLWHYDFAVSMREKGYTCRTIAEFFGVSSRRGPQMIKKGMRLRARNGNA